MQRKQEIPTGMGKLPAIAPLANPYVPFQADNPEQYEMGQGLIRGTMYPGLDLPFKGMVNKNPLPQSALAELQELGFAVQELALYLDTHRDDMEALELYRRYQRMYHDQRMEYAQKYGPLSHIEPITAEEYNWLNDPWPWEYCANKEG